MLLLFMGLSFLWIGYLYDFGLSATEIHWHKSGAVFARICWHGAEFAFV